MKRTISLLLSILMVLSLCPVTAFAADGTEEPAATETPALVETQPEESATEVGAPAAEEPAAEEHAAEEPAPAEEPAQEPAPAEEPAAEPAQEPAPAEEPAEEPKAEEPAEESKAEEPAEEPAEKPAPVKHIVGFYGFPEGAQYSIYVFVRDPNPQFDYMTLGQKLNYREGLEAGQYHYIIIFAEGYEKVEDNFTISADSAEKIGIRVDAVPLAVEEPVVEEPIIEEPVVEEPIIEEPIIEEPVVEEPVVEEPAEEPAEETKDEEVVEEVAEETKDEEIGRASCRERVFRAV